MRATHLRKLDRALNAFLDELFDGHVRPAGREATRRYVEGLLLDGERKSTEPMAQRLADDPSQVSALRQSLRFTLAVSPWDEQKVLARVGHTMLEHLPTLEAYLIDDTGFAKKGSHSVGVARQYSGTLGRVDNCSTARSRPACRSCPSSPTQATAMCTTSGRGFATASCRTPLESKARRSSGLLAKRQRRPHRGRRAWDVPRRAGQVRSCRRPRSRSPASNGIARSPGGRERGVPRPRVSPRYAFAALMSTIGVSRRATRNGC